MDEDFNNAMNGVEFVETLDEVNEEIVNENITEDDVTEPIITEIVSEENVTENVNDVNESFLNPPHWQPKIPKCLAITLPLVKEKTKKTKTKALITESQRVSTRSKKVVEKYGKNVGYQ